MDVESCIQPSTIVVATDCSSQHIMFKPEQKEIFVYILEFLWFSDVARLSSTSRFFAAVASSEDVQQAFMSRLFERMHRYPQQQRFPVGIAARGAIWRLCERFSTPMIFASEFFVTHEVAMDSVLSLPGLKEAADSNSTNGGSHITAIHVQGRATIFVFEVADSHFPCFPFKFSRQFYQNGNSSNFTGRNTAAADNGDCSATQAASQIRKNNRSKILIESLAPFTKLCYCSRPMSSTVVSASTPAVAAATTSATADVEATAVVDNSSRITYGAATLSCVSYFEAIFERCDGNEFSLSAGAAESAQVRALSIGLANPLFAHRRTLLGCDQSSFGMLHTGDLLHKGHILHCNAHSSSCSNNNSGSSNSGNNNINSYINSSNYNSNNRNSNGNSYNNSRSSSSSSAYEVGDVVGCGIVYPPLVAHKKGQLFFTSNGRLLFLLDLPDEDTLSAPWFPAVMHPPNIRSTFCFGVEQAFLFDVIGFEEQCMAAMSPSPVSLSSSLSPLSSSTDTNWAMYDAIVQQQNAMWNVPKHPNYSDAFFTSSRELQQQQQQQQQMMMRRQVLQDQFFSPMGMQDPTLPLQLNSSSNSSACCNQDDNVSLASTTAVAGLSTADNRFNGVRSALNSSSPTRILHSTFFDEKLRKECTLLVGRGAMTDRQFDSSDSSDAETSCRAGSSNSGELHNIDNQRFDTEDEEEDEDDIHNINIDDHRDNCERQQMVGSGGGNSSGSGAVFGTASSSSGGGNYSGRMNCEGGGSSSNVNGYAASVSNNAFFISKGTLCNFDSSHVDNNNCGNNNSNKSNNNNSNSNSNKSSRRSFQQTTIVARGSSDGEDSRSIRGQNKRAARSIKFTEGTMNNYSNQSSSHFTSATDYTAEQQQQKQQQQQQQQSLSHSLGINFDCINNDAVFDADCDDINMSPAAAELNSFTASNDLFSGSGSMKLFPCPVVDEDHDWCADSMAVELSSVDSAAVNEFRGCGISKAASSSSIGGSATAGGGGGSVSGNGSVAMTTAAAGGGTEASVRTGFMALADAARAHDWLQNASNAANAQNAHLCFLESVLGVSTGQSDACDSDRSVATSLFVEVASLDEDGSYIGYGGAACDDEMEDADSGGSVSSSKGATHGLSLHPYGRSAALSSSNNNNNNNINGNINSSNSSSNSSGGDCAGGRSRHLKLRHRRGYESDESFPNRRPVFGGSSVQHYPIPINSHPSARRYARTGRSKDGPQARTNRGGTANAAAGGGTLVQQLQQVHNASAFTQSISINNNGKRKRGQYFHSTSAAAKVNYKHRNVDGDILKVLNNRAQQQQQLQFPLQQASSVYSTATSHPIFSVQELAASQQQQLIGAAGLNDPFLSGAHRMQCQSFVQLQPPVLQHCNHQQAAKSVVFSSGPRSVASSSNQSMDNSSYCELDGSAEVEDGYDGASERGRGENDCLDEASDNDLDMTIDVLRSDDIPSPVSAHVPADSAVATTTAVVVTTAVAMTTAAATAEATAVQGRQYSDFTRNRQEEEQNVWRQELSMQQDTDVSMTATAVAAAGAASPVRRRVLRKRCSGGDSSVAVD